MNKVIIVGGSHHNTLGVIRAYGRAGINPYVILTTNDANSFVLKSRYIEKFWIMESTEVVEFLLSHFIDTEKPVLVACHDIISSVFDINYNKLKDYFFLPGAKKEGKITRLAEKQLMAELASRVGLDVPKFSIKKIDDCSINLDDVEYPCITKPIASREGSKADICVCYTKNELLKFFRDRPARSFIVQTFIKKDFEYQLIGCSLDNGNIIIIPGVSKLIRPSKSSNTGFLKYMPLDESFDNVVRQSKCFIKETGYNGLFSIEFLRDNSGKDYFMEINFRNDGNTICVTNAGVNLPLIWYNYSVGNPIDTSSIIHIEYVMPEFEELMLWYTGEISLWTMIKDFHQATSFMDYDKEDLSPTNGWRNFYKKLVYFIMAKPIKYLLYSILKISHR